MNNINYDKKLEEVIKKIADNNELPTLLLHSCCAPCSSYILEYLSNFFKITVFFYNPNIHPYSEYIARLKEQKRLISEIKAKNYIKFIEGIYNQEEFYKTVAGLEKVPEGGERCFKCYKMRLLETAKMAHNGKYDYFTTTLTVSPYKKAAKVNEIGKNLADEFDVAYLFSDFKKREGYKKSIEASKKYNLYRQNYCGCVFSKMVNN